MKTTENENNIEKSADHLTSKKFLTTIARSFKSSEDSDKVKALVAKAAEIDQGISALEKDRSDLMVEIVNEQYANFKSALSENKLDLTKEETEEMQEVLQLINESTKGADAPDFDAVQILNKIMNEVAELESKVYVRHLQQSDDMSKIPNTMFSIKINK